MRPTAAGFYPHILQPGAPPPQGEVLAATPLGQDQEGTTLVAYIVRKEGDAASSRGAASSANTNDPKAKPAANFEADLAQATTAAATAGGASAKFLKPDALLSRLEKAQVDHLRAREGAIKKELTGDASSVSTGSFIYQTGPDGRNYVVGVATPLVLQNMPQNE